MSRQTKIFEWRVVVPIAAILCVSAAAGIFIISPGKGRWVPPEKAVIREPVVAGTFYPGGPGELKRMIQGFLGNVKPRPIGNIRGVIVPHAGYIYSGQIAAEAFGLLTPHFTKVFILASNHSRSAPYFKCSLPLVDYYKTPHGLVKTSGISKSFLETELCSSIPEAHTTHVVEVELPFLELVAGKNFEIIPIVLGQTGHGDIMEIATMILKHLDPKTLIVISSDLSHFHPYEEAVKLDLRCIHAIEDQDMAETSRCEACGLQAIMVLLEISRQKGWSAKVLDYKNSGDTAGSKDRVVGYSAIAFFESEISTHDKKALLARSRSVLSSYIRGEKRDEPDRKKFSPSLFEKRGCFVTLEKNHMLRGCIGHITPQTSLFDCITENTISAAVGDPRFPPVTKAELEDIRIEISALTPPKLVGARNPEERLSALIPLKHGVIIKNGVHSSTYLPQVWKQLPEKKEFLKRLCIKGGMPDDCFKNGATEIYTYEATVFKEQSLPGNN